MGRLRERNLSKRNYIRYSAPLSRHIVIHDVPVPLAARVISTAMGQEPIRNNSLFRFTLICPLVSRKGMNRGEYGQSHLARLL
jgi:hypothetical protein